MIRHGKAPFLECSSKGDKHFSAFYASVRGRSIEDQYQAAKVFADGTTGLTWQAAKGKRATNQAYVAALYARLWDDYIAGNPSLLDILKRATGVSDMFGQPGHVCQATELWRIRCAALEIYDMEYIWDRMGRRGQLCRVLVHAPKMRSILVEFEDKYQAVTDAYAVRPARPVITPPLFG